MGILGSYMSIEENLFEQAIRGEGEAIGVEKFQQLDIDKSWEMIHFSPVQMQGKRRTAYGICCSNAG